MICPAVMCWDGSAPPVADGECCGDLTQCPSPPPTQAPVAWDCDHGHSIGCWDRNNPCFQCCNTNLNVQGSTCWGFLGRSDCCVEKIPTTSPTTPQPTELPTLDPTSSIPTKMPSRDPTSSEPTDVQCFRNFLLV